MRGFVRKSIFFPITSWNKKSVWEWSRLLLWPWHLTVNYDLKVRLNNKMIWPNPGQKFLTLSHHYSKSPDDKVWWLKVFTTELLWRFFPSSMSLIVGPKSSDESRSKMFDLGRIIFFAAWVGLGQVTSTRTGNFFPKNP